MQRFYTQTKIESFSDNKQKQEWDKTSEKIIKLIDRSDIHQNIEIQKYRLKKKYGRIREVSIVLQNHKRQSYGHAVPQLEIETNSIYKSRRTSREKKLE